MPIDGYAQITTAWQGIYKPIDIYRLKEFSVDASMDTDTDQWQISIGDPKHELIDVLRRDTEVRVSIFARDKKKFKVLQTGFADEIGFDSDGNLQMNGRDMTAIAVDSQAPPYQWKNFRPDTLIKNEARMLKLGGQVNIAPTPPFKTLLRDGSETYWEFWYRLMRKRSMWLWAEPDGSLTGGFLDYNAKPSYRFGRPAGSMSFQNPGWIPVEHAQWKKSTANRVGEVYAVAHSATHKFLGYARDQTIESWIKRPMRIITDSTARTQREADTAAREEIFESMVGAVEWQLVIGNTDQLIRQNTTAEVSIPEIGLKGTFFVVGCKTFLSVDEGLYQVVRLRERNFAISRHTPDDPSLASDTKQADAGDFGADRGKANLPYRWANCFIYAAQNHHGPWNMNEFLAVLLAICDAESGFKDVLEGTHAPEHPYATGERIPNYLQDGKEAVERFHDQFRNQIGKNDIGVGPMQLTTRSYKEAADKMFDPQLAGPEVEFVGGRWNPCSNIAEAAIVLRGKAKDCGAEGGTQIPLPIEQIRCGVAAYNGEGVRAEAYADGVMAKAKLYLETINSSMTTQPDEQANAKPVAKGTRAQLAYEILVYKTSGWYKDGNGEQTKQLEATRDGKMVTSQCGGMVYIDDAVLKSILLLLDNGFKVGTYALASDHNCKVAGSNNTSRHALGFALDISHIGRGSSNFLSLAAGGTECKKYTIQAMDMLRTQMTPVPSQIICDGVGGGSDGRGAHDQEVANHQWNHGHLDPALFVAGHQNHIHVGF